MSERSSSELDGRSPETLFTIAIAAQTEGRRDKALIILAKLIDLSRSGVPHAEEYMRSLSLHLQKEQFGEAVGLIRSGQFRDARAKLSELLLVGTEYRSLAQEYLGHVESALAGTAIGAAARGGRDRDTTRRTKSGTSRPREYRQPEPVLRRTPQMDFSTTSFSPGITFTVSIYADKRVPEVGHGDEEIALVLPAGCQAIDIDVWLIVSPHFTLSGSPFLTMQLKPGVEVSNVINFSVTVDPEVPAGSLGMVSAVFAYNGRPCGKVSRTVQFRTGLSSETEDRLEERRMAPPFDVQVLSKKPTLLIQVVADSPDSSTRYQCKIKTEPGPGYANGVLGEWKFRREVGDIVADYMKEFTRDASTYERFVALKGAGLQLFDAAPSAFKKAFWTIVENNALLDSIYIVSDEPSFPWELMWPFRDTASGREERQFPLGAEFAVGRWIPSRSMFPPQLFEIRDSYVVAPQYQGSRSLKHSKEEAEMVCGSFSGTAISPASLAFLDLAWRQESRGLLHFCCHGATNTPISQSLYLDNDQPLSSVQVLGMDGLRAGLTARRSLVFLNACETGKVIPSLVGVGGFAQAFIFAGAGGVIAPLWSVKDEYAYDIATTFYRRIKENPERPFARIMSDIRRKAYADQSGEDTFAAYCFYGDPIASLSRTS